MLAPRPIQRFTDENLRQIKRVVRRQLQEQRLAHLDSDEIVQDAVLNLLRRADSFDPAVATWSTFIGCVVRSTIATAHRKAVRTRRTSGRRPVSLQQAARASAGQNVELAATIEDGCSPRQSLQERRSFVDRCDIKQDAESLLSALSVEQIRLLRVVAESNTYSAAARSLGLSRSTFQRRLHALRDYLSARGYGRRV
jgi:RNA polymerase sigma factor (sigma-70 family)